MPSPTRYRFADFLISPSRRIVLRADKEVPLIPRYFDLLVLLVERRHEAVHRRDIFDSVWSDVIVSDGALSQAIRTLRRLLGDDPRAPTFIRTVSRHGYQFVYPDVFDEPDESPAARPLPVADDGQGSEASTPPVANSPSPGVIETLLDRLTGRTGPSPDADEDRREIAERLHELGTPEVLRRLGARPGHEAVRALLRDTRWDVAGAQAVPFIGAPGAVRAAAALVWLRLRRAWRDVRLRWESASAGAGAAGALAGASGGILLHLLPDTRSPLTALAVLAVIGAAAGAWGGAAIGAGIAGAEAVARSWRGTALACAAALGGALSAGAASLLVRWALADLLGVHVERVGGAIDGLILGAAAGIGYALATPRDGGGLATPRGRERLMAALVVAVCCMTAGLALSAAGRPMVGGLVHEIARATAGSQGTLTPLARWLGEPDVGRSIGLAVGAFEGGVFGFGLALGLTRRPRV